MPLLEKQLFIKRSTLPKAGKGLFSKRFIPKGTRIAEYKGRIRTWKEIKGDPAFNGYVYYINHNYVIDAKDTKTMARFANDAKGLSNPTGFRNNSKYEQDGFRVYITATKDIPAGSEILVGYGKEYWDVVRSNQTSKNH